ncbi:MAG TPA: DegT/DnrJ/EryC1/StrS family aminotransferase [Candidatus Kapabacteria bacterium]|nr:DegT/DnrJ/EryC1/StrS family aminotransferase [Candidatus Kapabacteria bacterium]
MPGFEIFGDEERNEIKDALDSGVLFRYGFDGKRNGNWKVKQFESDFAAFTNTKHSLLVSSGTAALITALSASGIGYGDEVIVPTFTFVATIEAVLNNGAIPIFVDIDETLCLDPEKIESYINPRTKAIVVVHMCGAMAQIDKIKQIAEKYNLILIEDACQATGAFYEGKSVGTFGNIACFSFDAVKTITCGEGGGIITNDSQLYQLCDQFHDHGHDHIGNDRGAEQHPIVGMNFRNNELNASIGIAQLKKINTILNIQRRNAYKIIATLQEFKQVQLRKTLSKEADTCTFVNFFLTSEDLTRKIAKELIANGIDGTFYWFDNNWHYFNNWQHIKNLNFPMNVPQTSLEYLPDYNSLVFEQSDDIMSRTISLQIKLSWTESELQNRCKTIRDIFTSCGIK